MVPISGARLAGLLLIFVLVFSFTQSVALALALGSGFSKGGDAVTALHILQAGNGVLGVEDELVVPATIRDRGPGAGDHKSTEHTEGKWVGGVRLMAKDVTNVNAKAEKTANDTKVGTSKNGTLGASPPIRPAPGTSKNKTAEQSPPENVPRAPAPPAQDASTGDEARSASPHGGTCTREHGPVIGKLAASGGDDEDGDHDYTLTIENGGGKSQLDVTVKTSKGWKAYPVDFLLTKGEMLPVTISLVEKEAAKWGARINVSWGEGDCHVDLPPENVGDNLTQASYLSRFTAPAAFALVLGGILVFVLILGTRATHVFTGMQWLPCNLLLGAVGVWRCISWRAHARRHGRDAESKYQELEMALPATAVSKQDDGMSPSADGWDEVWEDDDWQDTEAVRSSSTSLTLSSKGLNSRRANKDSWDNSWDD